MTLSLPRPLHRLERLRNWMAGEDVDCTVVFGADNVNHLCGYWRYFGGPSALVVGRHGERTLAVMLDEVPIARALSEADGVLGYGERGFGINLDPVAGLVATVAAVPAVAQARRLGVSSELAGADVRLAAAVSGTVVGAGGALHGIRLIKDWDELEKINAGYELCWLGQEAVSRGAVPGVSEIELFTAAQSTAQIASGGPIEFVCDLLSGPNAAEVCCPIHVAGTRTVEAGDPVIADVVVRTAGYWGDTAETHVAGTNADAEAARATLLDILEQARAELVPGATGAEVFANMHARVVSLLPGGELPHHGGHALGLTSFEDPHLIPSDTMPFEPWMVIAVEPGVYFAGRYGARVENVFVVTPSGGIELRDVMAGGSDGS
jgi:Xaa-Pro aminopeptidase